MPSLVFLEVADSLLNPKMKQDLIRIEQDPPTRVGILVCASTAMPECRKRVNSIIDWRACEGKGGAT